MVDTSSADVIIESKAVGPFFKNGYLVGNPHSGKAIYIDPGDEVEQILALLTERSLELQAILLTHAHMDHISGISRVRESSDAPIYLHPLDRPLYDSLPEQARFFGFQYGAAPPVDHDLSDGEAVEVAGMTFQVHFTPGHSPGHVCLQLSRHVFCGDVVFQGSIGRTDLPGGSHQVLLQSIRDRVLPLGDDKILYPGHGPTTSIGQERRTNPFLVGLS